MKEALFINSQEKTITKVQINDLSDLQKLVGGYICLGTTLVKNNIENTVFVDDEGLLKGLDNFFFIKGSHQPFAGNGVLIGTNEEGEDIDTNFTVEEISKLIVFLSAKEVLELVSKGNKNELF